MKTTIASFDGMVTSLMVVAGLSLADPMFAAPTSQNPAPDSLIAAATTGADKDKDTPSASANSGRRIVRVETSEPDKEKEPAKEVAWLGISTEEISDALSAQLGLTSGEGLVVLYVAPNSPASKAELEKFDVLVSMDDQLLVHPSQLRKLVRTKKDGDSIKLTLYRQGKKQTVSATLGKTAGRLGMFEGPDVEPKFSFSEAFQNDLHRQLSTLHATGNPFNQQEINLKVKRSMETASKALQEALAHKGHAAIILAPDAKEIEALASGRVELDNDATVVVKKDGRTVKTIARCDDSGSYVIVATPKKHLTVHDKKGNLLFDGEIETEEQQQKVPAKLWENVKPMLEQMGTDEGGKQKPQAESEVEQKS